MPCDLQNKYCLFVLVINLCCWCVKQQHIASMHLRPLVQAVLSCQRCGLLQGVMLCDADWQP